MDFVILVWVDGNTQIQRIKNRDKLGREEAINRINAQMSLEKKKEFASIILDNNGDLLNTKNQVEGLVEFFKEIC